MTSPAHEAREAYLHVLHGTPEFPDDGIGEPPPRETEAWNAAVEVIRKRLAGPEERYRNALLWVRTIAGMHYFGGAFEPEHMRDLANLAANALNGTDLPDCEESSAKARKKASKWAQRFGRELAEQELAED